MCVDRPYENMIPRRHQVSAAEVPATVERKSEVIYTKNLVHIGNCDLVNCSVVLTVLTIVVGLKDHVERRHLRNAGMIYYAHFQRVQILP